MIPNGVVVIAEELALDAGDSAAYWSNYTSLAWKIYNRLRREQEAEEKALHAPDD